VLTLLVRSLSSLRRRPMTCRDTGKLGKCMCAVNLLMTQPRRRQRVVVL
jgi:hypothetical protein